MKNFLFLLLVTLFSIAVLLLIYNPEALNDVYLWIVGLIGPIAAVIRNIFLSIKEWLSKNTSNQQPTNLNLSNAQRINKMEEEIQVLKNKLSKN